MIANTTSTITLNYTLDYLKDEHAREALIYYAYLIRETNPELSVEMMYEIDKVTKSINGY